MQKTVNLYPAVGVPGQEVNVHTAIYTPFNYISDGTAAAGSFVFVKANTDDTGVVYPLASATGSGTVIGLVENTFTGTLAYNQDGTLIYPQGANLTIAVRGDRCGHRWSGRALQPCQRRRHLRHPRHRQRYRLGRHDAGN